MPKPGLSGAAGRISSSIIAERSHRFYARGFSGWKITGGQGHSCQRDHDCCERKRIGWSCTEKERGDRPRHNQRRNASGGNSDQCEQKRFSQDAELHLCHGCAQRHPDANLLGGWMTE